MKKRLLEKLSQPEIDRKFKWFWKTYIDPKFDITYPYFMAMLDDPDRMRDDVKKAINEYLNQE